MAKKVSDKKLQKKIRWTPFDKQKMLIDEFEDIDHLRLAAGTRFGKSMLCAYFATKEVLKTNTHTWIVAPTMELTEKVFTYVKKFIGNGFPQTARGFGKRPTPHLDNPAKNSWIRCKTADNTTSLLGEELDLIIMDEAARMKREVWDSYIRQRLTSREGKSIAISTPFGRNWFYQNWKYYKDAEDGVAYRFPTKANPYFPDEMWEKEKKELPDRIFKQEHEASFLPDAAGVFRHPRECITGDLEEPKDGHLYVMGIDLGRYHDFTVLVVIDRMSNHVVYFDRFQGVDWTLQKKRILGVAKKYKDPVIWMDSTSVSVGDSYVRELEDKGFAVNGYKISSNVRKRQLIENLIVKIEQKQVTYPEIEDLIEELEVFGYNMTDAGNITYQAPQGLHDDAVDALALAVWDLDERPLEEIEEGQTGLYTPDVQNF